jgi:hypothetical protein
MSGQLRLHQLAAKTVRQLDLHVNHQLFVLAKMSLTRDGTDQIVTCAWNGKQRIFTYMFHIYSSPKTTI